MGYATVTSTRYGLMMGDPFSLLFFVLVLLAALALWIALARSSLISGGGVERPDRVPQLYGYTVCLVALVVMLSSLSGLVDNTFRVADPLLAGTNEFGWGEPTVTSFEAYRATHDRGERMGPDGPRPREVVPEPELRRRYEGLRADHLVRARFSARRGLTSSAILFLVSAILFVWHWRWVRSRDRTWNAPANASATTAVDSATAFRHPQP